jgi:hypothetical protein
MTDQYKFDPSVQTFKNQTPSQASSVAQQPFNESFKQEKVKPTENIKVQVI